MSKHEKLLFDRIATPYGLFYQVQKKKYTRIFEILKKENIYRFSCLCDVGCGTGALASAATEYFDKVYACDVAGMMIDVAKKKTKGQSIEFRWVEKYLPFDDQSMDVVTISYVLHGMNQKEREDLLKECIRISKKYIIIIEFNQKRHWMISFVEWLEKGDYFAFIKTFDAQLSQIVPTYQIVQTEKYQQIYICDVSSLKV